MPTKIPGPRPYPVIGTAWSVDPSRLVQSDMELAEQYGEIFVQRFPGRAPVIFVSSRRLVAELCDESRFDKQVHPAIENVRAFAGNGLFTADTPDPDWQKAHRVLMPAFSPMALSTMYDDMVDIAEQLLLKWSRLNPGEKILVTDDFTRLTLDTIALCSFRYRFNSFYSENMHDFVEAMVSGLEESSRRAHKPEIVKKTTMRTSGKRLDKSVEVMHQIVDDLIARRRRDKSPDREKDILDLMLEATDPETGEHLSDENVRFQLVSFLIAGHETTSGLLSFAVYELLNNRGALREAQEFVDRTLKGRFPKREDLPRLDHIDHILRETLRLHPTAPAFGVSPFEPTTIGGPDGYEVNPGDTILVLLPLMHRDPEVWENPERFDPSRFEFDKANALPPHAWKPFGNGQRSCIGRGFAIQEATLMLTAILQNFDLELADPDYSLSIKETLTIKPDDLYITIKPRFDHMILPGSEPSESEEAETDTVAAFSEVPQHHTPMQVLYGSNADTARSFATRIAERAKVAGFLPSVERLDNGVDNLLTEGPVMIVTSSYEGLPPDNARQFVSWVEHNQLDLSDVSYAVFGCGNRQWANTFQRIPTLVDDKLAEHGARRIVSRGVADALGDFEGAFSQWSEGLWETLADEYGFQVKGETTAPLPEVTVVEDQEFDTATIRSIEQLSTEADGEIRRKFRIAVELPEGTTYETGDYLDVLPRNSKENVRRALRLCGLHYYDQVTIGDETVFAGEWLARTVDLNAPATRRAIDALLDRAGACPPDAEKLRHLKEGDAHEREIVSPRVSLLDLVESLHAVRPDLAIFAGCVPPLTPREYSISSTPLDDPRVAELTISEVAAPAWSGTGTYHGLATTWLSERSVGEDIPIRIRPGREQFRAPADLETPMVLVAAGSGIAPLRAFIRDVQLRAEQSNTTPAASHLYYGCHGPDSDALYAEEFKHVDWLTVHWAYSRHPREGDIRYAQHVLREDADNLRTMIGNGAKVLVCGSASTVAAETRTVLDELLGGVQQLEENGQVAVESFS
ncbi:cytochrome P450 [Corynebacterium sp. 3HC-13]|uniref:cytochrome P450 n=1 Tax=Corynebacterium poyangense TaxID=2684405 RepID=UPI001CCDE26A|nr:cytochrome P450 [Corynebacterium poyangense]MBZ8176533.1 cytochrome P450 [Corynebacterium poyangense]